ncbi:MAG: sensor histidine kinase [Vulcanimicrobiota bacterium]
MRTVSWLLLASLGLIALFALASALMRGYERTELNRLESSMAATARIVAPQVEPSLSRPTPPPRPDLQRALRETGNVTGSRTRVLDRNRSVWIDSLEQPPQQGLRFRPEIDQAFAGHYSAYTRFADENELSLALFIAWPVFSGDQVVGVVYISHTTDEILQHLGKLRRRAQQLLAGLTVVVFLAALGLSGSLSRTLGRLRGVVSPGVAEEGLDDVTRIERSFQQLVDNLETKVAELELERTRTRQFIEDVAHELKTPVTGLCGSVETLMAAELEPETQQKLLGNLEREAQRLSTLTSRLLERQKLDYYEMQPVDFELVSLLETVLDSFAVAAEKREVKLVFQGPDQARARGDADKLRRVVENLVENAVRCSPRGSQVTIGLEGQAAGWRVSVDDEGPGVPEALREKIFERHRQGKEQAGSLGLGLSIAAEIVSRHGHTLLVEPRTRVGSRFAFVVERTDT